MEVGSVLWDLLKTLLIPAQGVKSTDDPAFATEMTGDHPAKAGSGKSNPVVRNVLFFSSCFCFSSLASSHLCSSRVTLNFYSSCLHGLSDGATGVHYHTCYT